MKTQIEEPKLTVNAIKVLERRYLLKDLQGQIIETPAQLFRRVAKAVAAPEEKFGASEVEIRELEETFYRLMFNLEFVPNSPTLMNAGTGIGQLSACFVIPVEDSIPGIFNAVRNMASIHKSGGGTGFSFSHLRPKGDIVKTTEGMASGPISFMRVFDVSTDVIKQGGRRRGANMGILHITHPDIIEFITAKTQEGFLTNFNISVTVTDEFINAVKNDGPLKLINPRTKKVVKELKAKDVWKLIVENAWKTGDPGLVFIDEVNRHNPTPQVGQIEATNPCGEQPLLPYESCNLGSINVAKMLRGNQIDWEKLRHTVHKCVQFLDNVIEANRYPLPQISKITYGNRKIGLGVMGWADLLVQLKIPYDSEEALKLGEKLMKFIEEEGHKKSKELGEIRGSFPNFKGSLWEQKGYKAMRNSTVTTIAPTGTISVIASCSSGIEPMFAIAFIRNVMDGTQLLEVNQYFEDIAKERGFYSKELMEKVSQLGSIKIFSEIPDDVKRNFVTAHDVAPSWHVRMQAAFQKYTDNAVSKTVNLPNTATVKDVEDIYWMAYELKCKGITVYRYGSKKEQVLYIGSMELNKTAPQIVTADSEYAGGCPWPYCAGT
ncbi:MAG TPA: vitamin B12-dependent ribonucleotide reductase [Candidatus Krumholzibacteriaceae bacterium]|nr:vitamin B12-dependent ribonucleotide reductase [Candidatus Krumholzibacteriaceae bacterium]